MADYRLETCAYCQADTWCEIRSSGKPQCRGCKIERFFAKVLFPPLGYRLLAWQRRVPRDIYGNVFPETGRRKYRSAYISVGKKNGKSFLIGGLPIYHLLMEDERTPEAYGAAAGPIQPNVVWYSFCGVIVRGRRFNVRMSLTVRFPFALSCFQ